VFLIQSIDSLSLAGAVSRRAVGLGRRVPVLLEVKTSTEPGKHGVPPPAAAETYLRLQELPGLEPSGLMTLAPFEVDAGTVRASFRSLFRVYESLQSRPNAPRILSMGMSADFEIAIEEGSTMVRVGRALTSA
jgi:uncharacterized pyridoxal phosphate-containing UPF0001 family protein